MIKLQCDLRRATFLKLSSKLSLVREMREYFCAVIYNYSLSFPDNVIARSTKAQIKLFKKYLIRPQSNCINQINLSQCCHRTTSNIICRDTTRLKAHFWIRGFSFLKQLNTWISSTYPQPKLTGYLSNHKET